MDLMSVSYVMDYVLLKSLIILWSNQTCIQPAERKGCTRGILVKSLKPPQLAPYSVLFNVQPNRTTV